MNYKNPHLNPERPIELPTGDNRRLTEQVVNWHHVGCSFREVLRDARPSNIRSAPPALRRGWVALVISTHSANREIYFGVMTVTL